MAHTTKEELEEKLVLARTKVKVGGLYGHYKNPSEMRYRVISVGLIEETEEPCVIYEPLYDTCKGPWVRTVDNFISLVDTPKGPVLRFQLIESL